MKKFMTILLVLTISICFVSCSKSDNFNFFGTWDVDQINGNYRFGADLTLISSTGNEQHTTIEFNDDYTFKVVWGESTFTGKIDPSSLISSGTTDTYGGTVNWVSKGKHLTEEEKKYYQNAYGPAFDVSSLDFEPFNKDYDDLKVVIDKAGNYSKITFDQKDGPVGFLFTIDTERN